MAKSSSENKPCCSKDCKKNNDSLNSKIKDLTSELSKANNYIYHYKLAVAQLEGRLVKYKEREVKYIEKIRTLEMYRASNLKSIKTLDKELETLKEEKDVVDGKLACLLKSSKDLESLIESQRSDKVKEGVGYNAVPPAAADLYLSPKKDLPSKKPTVRGNQQNWNNLKTQQLGPDFVMKKKACFNYGDFNHLAYDCRRVKRGTTGSQNNAYMRPPHRPDGHRPHDPPMKPMRPNMNDARTNRTTFNKQAHAYANRYFQRTSAVRSQYRAPWVPTVNMNFPLINRKLPTGNSNVSTVCCCCSRHVNTARPKAVINRRNRVKDVQASACWVWKPIKPNSASIILKRYDYVDVRGRSSYGREKEAKMAREAWGLSMDASDNARSDTQMIEFQKHHGPAKGPAQPDAPGEAVITTLAPETTTSVTNAQLQAMIDQGETAALAARDANRNGDDSHTSGTGRPVQVARECTYPDFLKCQPLNFKGTEGVVGLRDGERKEYAGTLPLCNKCKFHHNGQCTIKCANCKRVGHLTRDCRIPAATNNHRNPICYEYGNQWHYRSDFLELKTKTMETKLEEYVGTLPLCNKCKFHHNGQCAVKYVNCKIVGHLTQDCRSPTATNNHRNPICYECRNQGHYRSDFLELKNQDHGNQAGDTRAHGMVHALEGGETNQDLNDVEDDINA
nr:reverse transcriptase domain-containing protein [Tanacetum cinerariifolium]